MNSQFRNKIVLIGLYASFILSGCSNRKMPNLTLGESIIYDYEEQKGTVSFDDLNQYFKVLTITFDGIKYRMLVIKENDGKCSLNDHYLYTNVLTSQKYTTNISSVTSFHEPLLLLNGVEFLEEQSIVNYLVSSGNIKETYEVKEVIDFFCNEILPSIDDKEKNFYLKKK